MDFQRTNGHSVSRLTAHIVWVTKYRYAVLEEDIRILMSYTIDTDLLYRRYSNFERSRFKSPHSYAY